MNISPQRIINEINHFCKVEQIDGIILPSSEFAHIVLDDLNLLDGHLEFCIEQANKWEQIRLKECDRFVDEMYYYRFLVSSIKEYKLKCIAFLEWLLSIDEDIRIRAEFLEKEGIER